VQTLSNKRTYTLKLCQNLQTLWIADMNPLDIHLKFDSEEQATMLLLETGVWLQRTDEDSVHYYDAPNYLTDVIGLIYKPTGAKIMDEEGLEFDEMADVGGWHVNMRGELPDAIKPYKITVSGTPYRIWD
jgi:hypothetical protein